MNLNLYYSGTKDIYESKSQGLTAEEVGHALFYALKDEGLNVLWDGNSANTVIVSVNVEPVPNISTYLRITFLCSIIYCTKCIDVLLCSIVVSNLILLFIVNLLVFSVTDNAY